MMKRKCLLLNTNLKCGGAERQLVQLAKFWNKDRWRIMVGLLEEEGEWIEEVKKYASVYSFSYQKPADTAKKSIWILRIVKKLGEFFEQHRIDVVISFLWFPTLIATLAARLIKKPPLLIWSVQSDLEQSFKLCIDGWLRRWLVRIFIVPAIDCFVAVSKGLRLRMAEFLGIPLQRFVIIPNGVDLDRIKKMARWGKGVPPKHCPLRLITVGRLHPAKGIDILLRALALLKRQAGSGWECYILGEGPDRPRLAQLVVKLGLEKHVHFIGHASNPYAWLSRADIFISPSRWETFGIAIVEAMALGLPVVATVTDGAVDIVSDGEDGLLVPIEDPKALSEAILRLLQSPELRERMSRQASRKAQRFDAFSIAWQYMDLIEKLLDAQATTISW